MGADHRTNHGQRLLRLAVAGRTFRVTSDAYARRVLKACLNGPRRPGEHPALPISPDEIAADVGRVLDAGADLVHLHVKDPDGADTFDAVAQAEVMLAVRRSAPSALIGVTTGAWALPDTTARLRAIASWTRLPDFASVNWHEVGADDVAAALLDRGIAVEAGLWHVGAVQAWRRSPSRAACTRVMLELPDGLDEAATEVEGDTLLTAAGPVLAPHQQLLLHGEGSSCWPAVRIAAQRGIATRIGLEDTLVMPDGSPAPDNATLVRAARDIVKSYA